MQIVAVQDRKIGDGHPPFFVAELGICHQGSVEIAKQLSKAAKDAGADCIKTETFQQENIVFDPNMTISYSIRREHFTENLLEHMEEYQLSYEEHEEIKRYSDELGLPFMSTAHDVESVDFLADIGAAAIKIASADIIHYPLIRHASRTGMVLFIDVGGAYQYEIEKALKIAVDAGAKGVVFNHHPGGHPAPAQKYDLRIIPHLKEILGVPVGTADHYDGYEMVYAAVAVGGNVVEKPVSLDRFIRKPEHIWSVSIDDLAEVITNMHSVYDALGISERKQVNISQNRVSLVAKKDLDEGSEINFENVLFGRPTKGISIEYWDIVEGRELKLPKSQGEFITWEDV